MKKVISYLFLFTSFNAYSQENLIERYRWYFSISGGASITTSTDLDYYSKNQQAVLYNAELLYSVSRYTTVQLNYDAHIVSGTGTESYRKISYTAGIRYNFYKRLFAEAGTGLYDINFLRERYIFTDYDYGSKNFYTGFSFGAGTMVNISNSINAIVRLRFHALTDENYNFLTLNTGLMFKSFRNKDKIEGKGGYYAAVFLGALDALAGNHKLAGAFGLEAGKSMNDNIFLTAGFIYNNPSRAKYWGSTVKERKYLEAYIGPKIYFGTQDVNLFLEPGFGYSSAEHSFDFSAETSRKNSFTLYIGAGAETAVSNEVDFFARLRYNNLLDLANDNFASFHGGVKYNF